jgi:2-desacetyl-2-hydroxyethyl bacteriochlorophyllide A dehydrogenase
LKAMAVTSYERPLESVDVPEPVLTHGHALIEVLTCGVCFSDVKTSRGKMPFSDRISLPHIPGHEICGRVVATDPDGAIEPGSRVVVYHVWACGVCARCRAGEDNICTDPRAWAGFTHPGGFQERLAVPLDRVVTIPDSIEPALAAPLTCALGTAYRSVISQGAVGPGTRAVIIGLGGVGIHALQIADVAGAAAVGLDTSEAAVQAARQLGLDARPADDRTLEAISRETEGAGVDVVIDTVGHAATIDQANRFVRPGGRIVAVGYSVMESFVLPSPRFVLEEVQLIGSRYVRLHELERAIALVASGRVSTVVDRVMPLVEVNDAFEALEGSKVVGRIVLDVGGLS